MYYIWSHSYSLKTHKTIYVLIHTNQWIEIMENEFADGNSRLSPVRLTMPWDPRPGMPLCSRTYPQREGCSPKDSHPIEHIIQGSSRAHETYCTFTEWLFSFLAKENLKFLPHKSPDEVITKYLHGFSIRDCVSYRLLYSKLPQNFVTWNNTYLLSCFCGSGQGCTGRAWFTSKLTHMAICMSQFFAGSWSEATLSSLLCGPLCRAAHNMAAGLVRASEWKKPERRHR